MAIALGVAAALYSERSTTGKGLGNLKDVNWAWVAAASLVQVLSMLAFALLYRDLLRANGRRLQLIWILAARLSANAIFVAVPVIGSGMAGRQMFRWFREEGADPAAASLALSVAGDVSGGTRERSRGRGRPSQPSGHDLRHSGLTWSAATGAPLAELMRREGHKDSRAAIRYQQATRDSGKVLADPLAALSRYEVPSDKAVEVVSP
jgi:hypothetical protein